MALSAQLRTQRATSLLDRVVSFRCRYLEDFVPHRLLSVRPRLAAAAHRGPGRFVELAFAEALRDDALQEPGE